MSDSVSMASKEAVPDVLDSDSRPEVAVSFGTILQRFGDLAFCRCVILGVSRLLHTKGAPSSCYLSVSEHGCNARQASSPTQ